jgi:hypothetical protein
VDPDQHLSGFRFGDGDLPQLQTRACDRLYDGVHHLNHKQISFQMQEADPAQLRRIAQIDFCAFAVSY